MASRLYRVREGDTVLTICLMHKISYETFIALNPDFDLMGVRDPMLLKTGEQLVVGTDPIAIVKRRTR